MYIPGKLYPFQAESCLQLLLSAINDCGTIMTMGELKALAYGQYGANEYIVTPEGYIVDEERVCTRYGLQDIADIYAGGLDMLNC